MPLRFSKPAHSTTMRPPHIAQRTCGGTDGQTIFFSTKVQISSSGSVENVRRSCHPPQQLVGQDPDDGSQGGCPKRYIRRALYRAEQRPMTSRGGVEAVVDLGHIQCFNPHRHHPIPKLGQRPRSSPPGMGETCASTSQIPRRSHLECEGTAEIWSAGKGSFPEPKP